MKNIYQCMLLLVMVLLVKLSATAQAKLVINGGVIIITNGASLLIDNADNTAIIYNGTGYIKSEGINNKLIWSIGNGNGNTFLVPFGNAANTFPLQFNAATGTGTGGNFIFSTYPTATWKNSDFLPPGVTNVNRNGVDNSAKIIDRFWQINAQGYTTKPTLSNLIFTYSDLEYPIPNTVVEATLLPQRWNSTLNSWSDYFPSSTINTVTNKITIPTVPGNQLYQWWTLVDISTPVPVTLVDFKATVKNKTVVTSWQTAAEINSSRFEIWRSKDATQFEFVGQLAAAGNSNVLLNYSFMDANPYNGVSYYRLKMIDLDGQFTWSASTKITISKTVSIALYPNPASAYINLSVSNEIAGSKPTAFIYDGKGSLVKSFSITTTWQQINIALLPAGVYNIQFIINNKSQSISFIKK